jgi:transcriptional regulator with XRE-family HTH domain
MAKRNIIGKRVYLARKGAKPPITQADLAARLQVKGLKIETGYREVTDIEAATIAEVLGVSISWLFGEDENLDKNRSR